MFTIWQIGEGLGGIRIPSSKARKKNGTDPSLYETGKTHFSSPVTPSSKRILWLLANKQYLSFVLFFLKAKGSTLDFCL